MATEEITISELELADEVLADMTLPVDTATETRAVTLKQLRAWIGSSLPTGFIIPAVGKISDERFTLLDGKTLSRAGTYEAFCNKVVSEVQAGNWFACSEDEYNSDISTYGQCGKFVVSNDYIRIPKITRFIGATITLSEIGKTYKESLPNIKGEFYNRSQANNTANGMYGTSGAFVASDATTSSSTGYSMQTNTSTTSRKFAFDASRSSSTYQNNAKVQPDHTKYPYYMVVSTEGQTAEVQIDINQVYEDLNIKANTSLSNVDSNIDYVVEKYQSGSNWYRKYKSGWLEQGGIVSKTARTQTINLNKAFTASTYTLLLSPEAGYDFNNLAANTYSISSKTKTNFSIASHFTETNQKTGWYACGY